MHGFIVLDGTPPTELLKRGREQVRQYGGRVVFGEVASAEPAAPPSTVICVSRSPWPMAARVTARRVLVATGLRDVLPNVPGLAEHWGHGVVHCPYCHGWEVRDEPIGVLATGPASIHHAMLFRQLTDDLIYFTQGTDLDDDTRARFAARDIRIIDTPIQEVVTSEDGGLAGVRLTDGTVVARRVLAVATPDAGPHRGPERLETADGGPARQHGPPLRLRHGRHHRGPRRMGRRQRHRPDRPSRAPPPRQAPWPAPTSTPT